MLRATLLLFGVILFVGGCKNSYSAAAASGSPAVSPAAQGASSPPPTTAGLELKVGLPGMPPYDPKDVYAFTRAGRLSPAVKGFPERVYVPDGKTNRLYVIDPATFRVIAE
ncbi:hypothetical protein DNA98_15030, partial [Meiothermus sp. Pnk-1]